MGQSFANTFGKQDRSATNDVLNGQVVTTGTPGAQTMADPNGGLSGAQIRNRKLLQSGQGFLGIMGQNQQGQQQGASQQPDFTFANNQPTFTPPTYTPPAFTGGPTGPFQGNDTLGDPSGLSNRMRRKPMTDMSQDAAPFFGRY